MLGWLAGRSIPFPYFSQTPEKEKWDSACPRTSQKKKEIVLEIVTRLDQSWVLDHPLMTRSNRAFTNRDSINRGASPSMTRLDRP